MTVTTILKLPAQPLPAAAHTLEGVSVTIWFVGCLVATAAFYHLINRKSRAAWPEFRPIFIGNALLAFWYLFIVLDRWLHYSRTSVVYGYIFVLPIFEISRVASTIYHLWGTYVVIWRELEDRFPKRQQGYWWFAARFSIFIVGLVSTYYVALLIAQVGVWVQFLSLNTIADIATKRTGFEITMTAFFVVFGLITLAAACASLLWKAWRIDGRIRRNRIYLLLATSFLLIRSLFEFALAIRAWGPDSTRQSLQPIKDVGYGIITLIYLGLMYTTAYAVSSRFDRGGKEVRLVESDIRLAVLKRLQQETDEGRRKSRPFAEILDDIVNDLETILRDGPLSCGAEISSAHKYQVAQECIQSLRRDYGTLDPREVNNHGSRSASGGSSFFGWRNGSSRPRIPSAVSNQSQGSNNPLIRDRLGKASNSPMGSVAPHIQGGNPGSGTHAAASRPPSFMPSMNSAPSRWAPSVSEYTELGR
ncbi:hypothetical protein F4823DRAFT_637149 [Ustulina deusta]|nr:hypothetical protein F4823DRAFT_637149 [Ustulina deusta]